MIVELAYALEKVEAAELMATALQHAVDSANDKTVTGLWQSLEDHISIEWDTKGMAALAAWEEVSND